MVNLFRKFASFLAMYKLHFEIVNIQKNLVSIDLILHMKRGLIYRFMIQKSLVKYVCCFVCFVFIFIRLVMH